MDWLVAQGYQGNNNGWDEGQPYKEPIICILNNGGV
jgi:hypothetical protein